MTFKSKYNENRRLLQGYVAYLDHCTTYEQKLKLSTEIGRLQTQNEHIKKMSVEDFEQDINDYHIIVNSNQFAPIRINPNQFASHENKIEA